MEPVTDLFPQNASTKPHRYVKLAMSGVLLALLFNFALSCWLIIYDGQQTVAFDMKGTIDQFMDQSAVQALSEAQSQLLVASFTRALNESLAAYQQTNRALILVSPSVVLGAPDITREIQQDVASRMRNGALFLEIAP